MIRANSGVLTAVVAALVVMLTPVSVDACIVVLSEPLQIMARRSAIIAEATAADTRHHFDITKVWKGSPARRVSLMHHQFDPDSSCYAGATIPGARYLLYIGCDKPTHGGEFAEYPCDEVGSFVVPLTSENLAYLEHPKIVSKREVEAMLRDWIAGTTPTAGVANWVEEIRDIAAFDDWVRIHDEERSLSLGIVLELDRQLNRRDVALEMLSCEIDALRTKVAPKLLEVLKQDAPTGEQMERIEDLFYAAHHCP